MLVRCEHCGHVVPDVVKKCDWCGENPFIPKPVSQEELQRALEPRVHLTKAPPKEYEEMIVDFINFR